MGPVMLPAYYALAEKDVIWFLISSSCRTFYGMLLHAMAHIAAVFSWTCRLGLIHHTACAFKSKSAIFTGVNRLCVVRVADRVA